MRALKEPSQDAALQARALRTTCETTTNAHSNVGRQRKTERESCPLCTRIIAIRYGNDLNDDKYMYMYYYI